MSVKLRLAGKDYFELEFANASPEEVVVLRPGTGDHLATPRGASGARAFPPPEYRFEASGLRGASVFREQYSPPTMWFAATESENAARAKGIDVGIAESKIVVPARGAARVTVDLPFKLPANDYVIRFWYEYFLSQPDVPARWYTGSVEAPPLLVSVAASGDLSLREGAAASPPSTAPRLGLALVEVAPGAYDVRFQNAADTPRVLDLPVDIMVDDEISPPTFKWEAIDKATGHVYRDRVGERAPRLDQPEAVRAGCPPRPGPKRPVLVVAARGDASLRVHAPTNLPNGSYDLRIGYDHFRTQHDPADVAGSFVSAPVSLTVQR